MSRQVCNDIHTYSRKKETESDGLGWGVSGRRILRRDLSQQRGNEKRKAVMREMGRKEERSREISECKALSQRNTSMSQAHQGGLCDWNAVCKGAGGEVGIRAKTHSSKALFSGLGKSMDFILTVKKLLDVSELAGECRCLIYALEGPLSLL